jgi:hypothetical protein
MRFTRKLMLLAMLALAATALAAPSAFAQDVEPELHNQTPRLIVQQEIHAANDVNCPAVTPSPPPNPAPTLTAGGCRLHVASAGVVAPIQHDAAGNEMIVGVAVCTMEFDLRIDSAGEGYLSHQEFTGPIGQCNTKPCGQVTPPTSEGRAFSFHARETEPAPREVATLLFCFEPLPSGTPSHCEITVPFSQTATHRYSFTASDTPSHSAATPRCELTGTFVTEAGGPLSGEGQARQNVEIRHT